MDVIRVRLFAENKGMDFHNHPEMEPDAAS